MEYLQEYLQSYLSRHQRALAASPVFCTDETAGRS